MNPFVDGRQEYSRPSSRFLIFALATVLAVGGLTTRLFYLQIVNGGQFATLSEGNRTAVEAIPSARGLIFDRNGRRARQERPDVRREDPAGRPARGASRRGRRPAGRAAEDRSGRHQRRRSTATPDPGSISSGSRPTSRMRRRA